MDHHLNREQKSQSRHGDSYGYALRYFAEKHRLDPDHARRIFEITGADPDKADALAELCK